MDAPTPTSERVRDTSAPAEGFRLEDLEAGMTARCARTMTEADVVLFAGVSGDCNPLHLNEAYASTTQFGSRIVHGLLPASLISAVIATHLPGPGSIYVSQNLAFRAPVRIGDTVEAEVTVFEIHARTNRVCLWTACRVGGRAVIDGDAVVLVRPRDAAAK